MKINLPHSPEQEKYVLGAMIADPDNAVDVALNVFGAVNPFYISKHQAIYSAIIQLYKADLPIDLISVSEKLVKEKKIDKVECTLYISDLASAIVSASNIEFHAKQLLEKYQLRKLVITCHNTINEIEKSSENATHILGNHEESVLEIISHSQKGTVKTMQETIDENLELINQIYSDKPSDFSIKTGINDFDELTGGFFNKDLVLLAGRPGQGKTAVALNLAANIAKKYPVGFYSLEMGAEQLTNRLMAMHADVDQYLFRTGKLNKKLIGEVVKKSVNLRQLPLYIDDDVGITPLEIKARTRFLMRQYGVKIIFVDYLQLIHPINTRESRERQVASISQALKEMAKSLNIPVIALCQISRKAEERSKKDRRPQLQDLRESGGLEADADMVLFVYRPEAYGIPRWEDHENTENTMEISIGKYRNGPMGKRRFIFLKSSGKLLNMAQHTPVEEPEF